MASLQSPVTPVSYNLNLSSVLLLEYFSLSTTFIISLLYSKIYSDCPLGQVQKFCLTSGLTVIRIYFFCKTIFFTHLSKTFSSWFLYFPLSVVQIFNCEFMLHFLTAMSVSYFLLPQL